MFTSAAYVPEPPPSAVTLVGSRDDAESLWDDLVSGRCTLVRDGSGYSVVENPPAERRRRALTDIEATIVRLAVRGTPAKVIAYEHDISASLVSRRLSSIAAKIGLRSRRELLRLAATLTNDAPLLAEEMLTPAEREILELIRAGYSNREIAAARTRSPRTIANQVAAVLRKTKTTSRRALLLARVTTLRLT